MYPSGLESYSSHLFSRGCLWADFSLVWLSWTMTCQAKTGCSPLSWVFLGIQTNQHPTEPARVQWYQHKEKSSFIRSLRQACQLTSPRKIIYYINELNTGSAHDCQQILHECGVGWGGLKPWYPQRYMVGFDQPPHASSSGNNEKTAMAHLWPASNRKTSQGTMNLQNESSHGPTMPSFEKRMHKATTDPEGSKSSPNLPAPIAPRFLACRCESPWMGRKPPHEHDPR